uniref:Peptidase M16C associated domain-containing protein n=1 Tax=Chromera velia CCMP2878 TaxID=1169474 RepID=A0A0G4HTW6_9ALVE|eukprot:Cvel_8526.t1-p1 / transcript=Cvel_8526.t1 / gene=Cvel_8526 / organism=Chromera_velia_CCMP2878 / gene_product=Uncharacterized protein YOL098C, putative / transcript_product=Uncharacterized protein YOL098C, putative / location=Cvel_scaffold472:51899-64913(-) / protein_length=1238 / sequence_SO=supercontig / SO=protein_coding / is_pseudo=false
MTPEKEEAGSRNSFLHFDQLAQTTYKGVSVREFQSRKTGVRVFLADVNSPLVNGYFTLITEALDDDGLPHTLEHLLFMGSEKFPYKGVLDLLANRCLAQGTNAWTATDHTAYTITTAGQEGFLNIFPVYLDHILRPLLREESFVTEVHHVTPEGEHAGVVYSEMEASENKCDTIALRLLYRELYPGKCGYKSETGGMLENLRGLTNEKVRQYHRDFYQWHNLNLIVTGKVDPETFLSLLAKMEEELGPLHGSNKLWKDLSVAEQQSLRASRPFFSRPIERFTPTSPHSKEGTEGKSHLVVVKEEQFPSDDESSGKVMLGWRGPEWKDLKTRLAVDLVGTYLTDSNRSPVERKMVQIAEPLCSGADFSSEAFLSTCFLLDLEDVPTEKLSEAGGVAMGLIEGLCTEGIDMERMRAIVQREHLQCAREFEEDPHETVATLVVEHAAYSESQGEDGGEGLSKMFSWKERYEELLKMDEDEWKALVRRLFVDSPRVEVRCAPSASLAKRLAAEEKDRKESNRETLGADGRKALARRLERIKEQQAEKAPEEVVDKVPLAPVSSVKPLALDIFNNLGGEGEQGGAFLSDSAKDALRGLPLHVHLANFESEFVTLGVIARSPTDISSEDLSGLFLLSELLFESGVQMWTRTGDSSVLSAASDRPPLSFDEFTQLLDRDLTDFSSTIGSSAANFRPGENPEAVFLSLTASVQNFALAFDLLASLMKGVQITPERVKVVATTLLNQVAKKKRSGRFMLSQLENSLREGPDSALNVCGLARQEGVLREAKENPEPWAEKLRALYVSLFGDPSRLAVSLSGNLMGLEEEGKEGKGKGENLTLFLSLLSDAVSSRTEGESSKRPRRSSRTLKDALSLPGARRRRRKDPNAKVAKAKGEEGVEGEGTGADENPLLPFGNSVTVGIASEQSSFLQMSVDTGEEGGFMGQMEIPLMVLCELVSAFEGPLYREVRGTGLAYGCDLIMYRGSEELCLSLSPATDAVKGLERSLECFRAIATGQRPLEPAEIEAAKSSALFSVISRGETLSAAAADQLRASLRGVGPQYNRDMITRIAETTEDDVRAAARQFLPRFLSFPVSPDGLAIGASLAVTTSKQKAAVVSDGLSAVLAASSRKEGEREVSGGEGDPGNGAEASANSRVEEIYREGRRVRKVSLKRFLTWASGGDLEGLCEEEDEGEDGHTGAGDEEISDDDMDASDDDDDCDDDMDDFDGDGEGDFDDDEFEESSPGEEE